MARRASGAGARTSPNGTGPKRLTKDELLAQLKTREEDYELPNGSGTVRLRSVAVKDYATIEGFGKEGQTEDALKRICLLGIVEPALSPEDLEALTEADIGVATALATRIMQLSGMLPGGAAAFLATTAT